MNIQLNIRTLCSSPNEESLLLEVNIFHSNTMILKRILWDLQSRRLEWDFENPQNTIPPLTRIIPNQQFLFLMDMLRSILKDHLLTSFKDHILLDLRTDLKIILFNLQDFLRLLKKELISIIIFQNLNIVMIMMMNKNNFVPQFNQICCLVLQKYQTINVMSFSLQLIEEMIFKTNESPIVKIF